MQNNKIGFVDFLFIFLIIINLFDFFEFITPELSLLDNLVSWSLMIYLLYRLGFTRILVGYREKFVEILLLFSYTLFILKDLIFYLTHSEFDKYESALTLLQMHQDDIILISFSLSAIILLFLTVYISKKLKIEEKSMLGALGLENQNFFFKLLISLLCISFAAYFIFMTAFQWFAIVIDAPLVMIAFVYYFIAARKYHEEGSKIKRIADFGEIIVEKFVEFFHRKETIHLGLISLLTLHFFTDLFVFALPSVFGFNGSVYAGALSNAENIPLHSLFIENITGQSFFITLNIFLVYFSNIIFLIAIFIFPLLMLKSIYDEKKFEINNNFVFFIITFLPIYFIFPIYKIKSITNVKSGVSGVNIILEKIMVTNLIQLVLPMILIFFLIILILNKYSFIESEAIALILVFIPIITYVKGYAGSTVIYYIEMIRAMLDVKYIILVIFFFIFLFLIIFFYWISLSLFIYHTFRLNFQEFIFGKIENEKEKRLFKFMAFIGLIYLSTYFISTIFQIFRIKIIDFFIPLLVAIILFIIPKLNPSFFTKIDFGMNLRNLLITPLSVVIGVLFGVSLVYFREPLIFSSKYIIIVAIYLIFVSLSEEILFRHYFHNFSKDALSFRTAIIFQSLIFAIMHMPKGININIFIVLVLFAVAATIIKEKAELFNAIVFHLAANLFLYFNQYII